MIRILLILAVVSLVYYPPFFYFARHYSLFVIVLPFMDYLCQFGNLSISNKTLFIHDNLIKCTFYLPNVRDC